MRTEWITEHCPYPPKKLEADTNGMYIQRRDIHEVYHEETDGMPAYTDWECEMRVVDADEAIKSLIESSDAEYEQVAVNTANIDYIAMMSDIEL